VHRSAPRIADALHDNVAQILFAAQLQLDALLDSSSIDADSRAHATHARGLLIRGDCSIRNVIAQLSRPVPNALGDRLAETVDGLEEEFMTPVHLEISSHAADAGQRVRRAIADTVVKVAHEAVVNAFKHAGPCRVSAILDSPRPNRLRLRVIDDGVGMIERVDTHSHGMMSLRRSVRKHGGTLRVARATSGGTIISVNVPI
jgi:signal transduction histidine kinase